MYDQAYQNENKLFVEFKGALTEQFVLQQIKSNTDLTPFYWTAEKGKAEVSFLLQIGMDIVPVEVKAEVNLQSKSLKTYREKYAPEYSIRVSMENYKKQEWLINLPLYAVSEIDKLG